MIEVITPVHIGTGEDYINILLKEQDGKLNKFALKSYINSFEDYSKFLNDDFLKLLSATRENNNTKQKMLGYFSSNLEPSLLANEKIQYSMQNNVENFENKTSNVKEQVKDMDIPYIPGSTIKGAIVNAILYDILSLNFLEFKELLQGFRNSGDFTKLLSKIKEVFQYLHCEDIYFSNKDFSLEELKRVNMSSKNARGNSGTTIFAECLKKGSTANKKLFKITYIKEKHSDHILKIKKGIDSSSKEKEILNMLLNKMISYFEKPQDILTAINNLTTLLLEEEMNFYENLKGTTYSGVINNLKKVQNKFDEKNPVLRVGMFTNYYFKSLTNLVNDKDSAFFEKRFFDLFSPIPKNKKQSPKPELIPNTRWVIGANQINYTSAGYIKFYDNEI